MKRRPQAAHVPTATYRLQVNRSFTFKDATSLVEYLHALGISDCYASPLFAAPPESNHGYDVCDYNALNPALGTQKDFADFSAALKRRNMGLLLDFVPNHMAADPELNPWWRDVLEWGDASPFANYFDIDWTPAQLPFHHRVVLPMLGEPYHTVLESGAIQCVTGADGFNIRVYDKLLPLNPAAYGQVLQPAAETLRAAKRRDLLAISKAITAAHQKNHRGDFAIARDSLQRLVRHAPVANAVARALEVLNGIPGDRHALHGLLDKQVYRLAHFPVGTRLVNYRRFFDVDGLVAMRMEKAEVFRASHALLFRLVEQDHVTALRLDHIDGLADPEAYLRRLQSGLQNLRAQPASSTRPFPILVEKITTDEEPLPLRWPVAGTTGYEFARDVTGLLINAEAGKSFTDIYKAFTGCTGSFEKNVLRGKELMMAGTMSKEISALARHLFRCAQTSVRGRDLPPDLLAEAVHGVVARFPVYRTYLRPGKPVSLWDQGVLAKAVEQAGLHISPAAAPALDYLRDVLLRAQNGFYRPQSKAEAYFVQRFQQTTGGIMAKGSEDTAFFAYNRLQALNEVGGNPATFGLSVADFHARNLLRRERHPRGLVAASTHDTKVSEDVRARLAALSEVPEPWLDFLSNARLMGQKWTAEIGGKTAPDANEQYLFFQILFATWPLEKISRREQKDYLRRLQDYMIKAVNEAKVNSTWPRRHLAWEEAVVSFVTQAAIAAGEHWARFSKFAQTIAELGAVNSLSQLVLKLTAPGVPDIFQGNELWQFILVDPDNRRPVDYAPRLKLLAQLAHAQPARLLANWRTGAIKLFVHATLLRFRRAHPLIFEAGNYQPLEATGPHRDSCAAFARVHQSGSVVVIVPRLSARVGFPPIGKCWQTTTIYTGLPEETACEDVFTHQTHLTSKLRVAEVFSQLPFAVLAVRSKEGL